MKKNIILLIVSTFVLSLSGKSQCNNYQYHILESVSNIYEVSDNTFEAFILIRSAFESDDFEQMELYVDTAKAYLDLVKTSSYYAKTSIELAYNDAEMCYCLNGQKKTGDISDMIDEMYDKSKEISKLIKKNSKTTDKEISKRYIYQIMEILEYIKPLCDKASKECVNAQEACY